MLTSQILHPSEGCLSPAPFARIHHGAPSSLGSRPPPQGLAWERGMAPWSLGCPTAAGDLLCASPRVSWRGGARNPKTDASLASPLPASPHRCAGSSERGTACLVSASSPKALGWAGRLSPSYFKKQRERILSSLGFLLHIPSVSIRMLLGCKARLLSRKHQKGKITLNPHS